MRTLLGLLYLCHACGLPRCNHCKDIVSYFNVLENIVVRTLCNAATAVPKLYYVCIMINTVALLLILCVSSQCRKTVSAVKILCLNWNVMRIVTKMSQSSEDHMPIIVKLMLHGVSFLEIGVKERFHDIFELFCSEN
jgi:hypothetical protein